MRLQNCVTRQYQVAECPPAPVSGQSGHGKTVSAQCISALSYPVNVTVNKTPLQGILFILLNSLMYWSDLRRLSLVYLNEVNQSGK